MERGLIALFSLIVRMSKAIQPKRKSRAAFDRKPHGKALQSGLVGL